MSHFNRGDKVVSRRRNLFVVGVYLGSVQRLNGEVLAAIEHEGVLYLITERGLELTESLTNVKVGTVTILDRPGPNQTKILPHFDHSLDGAKFKRD